jgi:hypothetical protein
VEATPRVTKIPGTRPRMEKDQGKERMARQMYSEKRRAAVLGELRPRDQEKSVNEIPFAKSRICILCQHPFLPGFDD